MMGTKNSAWNSAIMTAVVKKVEVTLLTLNNFL